MVKCWFVEFGSRPKGEKILGQTLSNKPVNVALGSSVDYHRFEDDQSVASPKPFDTTEYGQTTNRVLFDRLFSGYPKAIGYLG